MTDTPLDYYFLLKINYNLRLHLNPNFRVSYTQTYKCKYLVQDLSPCAFRGTNPL